MESRKLSLQVMQKVLTTSWFFITSMQHILSYLSHIFLFVNFISVLSFIVIFQPSRQKPRILAGVCAWIMSQGETKQFILLQINIGTFAHWVVDFNQLFFNAIFIVFYQYFTILSTLNKVIIIIIGKKIQVRNISQMTMMK